MAEQQRLAELKRTDPGLAQAQIAQATQKRSSIMPDQTRDALKRLADSMLRASGQQATPVSAPAPLPAATTPPPAAAPAAQEPATAPPAAKQGADARTAPIPASACGRRSHEQPRLQRDRLLSLVTNALINLAVFAAAGLSAADSAPPGT